YGKQDLSREFVDAYVEASGDPTLNAVLPFYKCYRAYVRGKVESFKLDDAYLSDSDKAKALKSSRRYFELAYSYAAKPPVLIIMVGLVGTGKTTVAQTLAQTLGAKVISSDVVRKTLAGIPLTEHRYDEVDTGIYSSEFSRRTFAAFFDNARHLLSKGESVVLDATFQRRSDRARAKAIADELSARFLAVECMLPEDEVKRRLEQRMKEPAVSDARWDIYVQQKTTFEPVTELADSEHIVVDTSVVWNDALAQIVQRTDP
ncbi:MAG: AAA family ATPase, partial [Chloroflexi bacterium]|nr:AAA family ATPase [Chloroflexota bacterium]